MRLGNGACRSRDAGFSRENWFFCNRSPCPRRNPACPTSGGTTTPGYYSYNAHSDVEALTGTTGTTTYGYTAYGNPVTSMFTGSDKNDAASSPTSTTQPYSSYRFNAMRWDGTSGQYDMGFRNYDPGLNQFVSRDMYDGATQDMGLSTDPFTGSPYAFGNGNPITNIENDGHTTCDQWGTCSAANTPVHVTSSQLGGPGYQKSVTTAPPSSGSSSGGGWWGRAGDFLGGAINSTWNGITGPVAQLGCSFINSVPTGMTSSGGFIYGNNASCNPPQIPVGNPGSGAYKVGYIAAPIILAAAGITASALGRIAAAAAVSE